MGQIAIRSDKYLNNKQKLDGIFGEENICPVDLNAGYVALKTDKYGQDEECGEYVQDNIRERFGLEAPEQDEGDES